MPPAGAKMLYGTHSFVEGLTGFWLCESLDSQLPISRWITEQVNVVFPVVHAVLPMLKMEVLRNLF